MSIDYDTPDRRDLARWRALLLCQAAAAERGESELGVSCFPLTHEAGLSEADIAAAVAELRAIVQRVLPEARLALFQEAA